MLHETRIFIDPVDVDARLAQLAIPRSAISDVHRAAIAARNSATPHHPRNHGGVVAFGDSVCALRDALVSYGYKAVHEGGLEKCVNEALEVAIVIAAGNAGTGRPDCEPSTERERGGSGAKVIEQNQISLFTLMPGFDVRLRRGQLEPRRPSRPMTWHLLVRYTGKQMWSELSLPISVDDEGQVDGWDERILFPPVDFGAPDPSENEVPEPTPEIDIEILARGR